MGSQLDLDQGGTQRQWLRSYMGPSVGWVSAPLQNILPVTAGGTYILDPSVSLVEVNTTGAVTIVLPSAANPGGSLSQQALFAKNPITIVDVGGNAAAHPITIQPAVGQTIMGLASITLSVNFGGYTLQPIPAQLTWNSISP
jgi:hypothetical protein